MNWDFLAPHRLWWLLAVAALAAAYVAMQFRRKTFAVRFSNLDLLDKVAPSSGAWKRHVVAGGYLLGLAAVVVAMAQPLATDRVPKQRATIMLAIDTSLSMQATDVAPTRIDAAKKAAVAFVNKIPKRLQIGLLSFNGSAQVDVAPTQDRDAVVRAIKALKLDERTAIGSAVTAALQAIAKVPPDENGKKAPAAIVLLSDGMTTQGKTGGQVAPDAKAAGVAVWTIAYGTPEGTVEYTDPETGITEQVGVPVDYEELQSLADGSGGKAFRAESEADLTKVYSQLGDSIGYDTEKVEITWKVIAGALAALFATGALSVLWFQRLP
jgi:Ca-activated chloride channel family protein